MGIYVRILLSHPQFSQTFACNLSRPLVHVVYSVQGMCKKVSRCVVMVGLLLQAVVVGAPETSTTTNIIKCVVVAQHNKLSRIIFK